LSIKTQRSSKRSIAAVIACALLASVLALVSTPAAATTAVTQKRLSGLDRYATAAATAEYAYTGVTVTQSIIASGENYADALTAAALSGAVTAPIFLTATDALPAVTAAAMARVMGTNKGIYVVGGESAVSAKVVTTLTGLGYVVTRISGSNRYATAAAVAAKITSLATVGSMNGKVTCVLASGQGYADALSAGPLAHSSIFPILLTEPNTLTAATSAAITATGCKQMMIVGGESTISAAVATAADALAGVSVIRLSGADRYATSVAIANKAWEATTTGGLGWAKVEVALARGDSFADGLAASQLAKGTNRPLLLVQADMIPAGVSAALTAKGGTLNKIHIVGGLTAITAALAQSADDAATIGKPTATVTGAVVGSNAVRVTYSERMDSCSTRGDYKINNAALAANSADAVDSYAASAAPFAASQTTFTYPGAAEQKFKVGNRVLITAQGAVGNFVADTLGEGTGHTAYTDGTSDPATVTATAGATVTVTGVFATTDAAVIILPAADIDHGAGASTFTSCTIHLAVPLVAGDVFSWSTANKFGDTAVVVTAASSTVPAISTAAKPTATVTCLTGGINTVWVEFDQPTQGVAAGDLTNSSDETVASAVLVAGTNRYAYTMNNAMESGDTVTFAAAGATGQNGQTGPLAAVTATCANAPTKPAMLSATAVETVTTSGTCLMDGGAEDVTFTWNKTGFGKGIRGNSYKIQTVDSNSGTAAITSSYNSSTKTLVMKFDDAGALDPSTTAVAAALQADATFGPAGTAVVSASAGNAYSTVSTTTCGADTAGVSSVTATVKYNSKMSVLAASIDAAEILLSDTTLLAYQALANVPIATRAAQVLAWDSNTIKYTWAPAVANVLTSSSKIRMDGAAVKTHNLIANTAAQTINIG
jgi:putative cell wall-binding protein